MIVPRLRYLGAGALLCSLTWLAQSESAAAFCRTSSVETKRSCGTCETQGPLVARPEPSIEYVFNEAGFPGIEDSQLRAIFSDAFATWTSVACDGEPLSLDVTEAPGTTALQVRDDQDHLEVNVIGHMSGKDWVAHGRDRFAFALTSIRYSTSSGKMWGADIWFNGGMGEFGVCPSSGCEWPDETIDLPNVATHEIGHFLGLDHSREPGATMACEAASGATDKRSLSSDDEAGLCAIYPPAVAFHGDYVAGEWQAHRGLGKDGCGVRQAGGAHSWLLLALVPLGLLGRRARSQPRK